MKFTARDLMTALTSIDSKGKVYSHKNIPLAQQFYGHDSKQLLAEFQMATNYVQELGLRDLTGEIAKGNKDFYHGSIPAKDDKAVPWVIFEGTEWRIQHLMECCRKSVEPGYRRTSENENCFPRTSR
jgi:hypothetical protein